MGTYHPRCNRKDCFAYMSGLKEWGGEGCCSVLSDNAFKRLRCPFFKTAEEFKHHKIHKEV